MGVETNMHAPSGIKMLIANEIYFKDRDDDSNDYDAFTSSQIVLDGSWQGFPEKEDAAKAFSKFLTENYLSKVTDLGYLLIFVKNRISITRKSTWMVLIKR